MQRRVQLDKKAATEHDKAQEALRRSAIQLNELRQRKAEELAAQVAGAAPVTAEPRAKADAALLEMFTELAKHAKDHSELQPLLLRHRPIRC